MKFVCAFAWADLEIQSEERHFVDKLVEKLGLEEDRELIVRWLRSPPPAEEVDPTRVPPEHREVFLDAARQLFEADGVVDPHEQEQFELLQQLLI
ncbi:MAG: TerB family tellurite resistance protein [Nannocystaceae bacterium]|nr:TerB family tellurite resistance protein [Nannocystaceae bacterium]